MQTHKGKIMTVVFFLIGAVLMFGAGELYGQYRETGDRRTLWMCVAGVLIGILNFISASGVVK
jgi:hypothetical protein